MKTKTGLTFVSKTFNYNEDKQTIVCILKGTLNTYSFYNKYNIDIQSNWYKKKCPELNYAGDFTVIGIATCSNSDTYNEEVGKRIAESRAKVQAYNIAKRFYSCVADKIQKQLEFIEEKEAACNLIQVFEKNHVAELIENT